MNTVELHFPNNLKKSAQARLNQALTSVLEQCNGRSFGEIEDSVEITKCCVFKTDKDTVNFLRDVSICFLDCRIGSVMRIK